MVMIDNKLLCNRLPVVRIHFPRLPLIPLVLG